MSFLDFPGLQYFYNKYLKPIKPHAREETIKSYTVNEQGHVPDAQLVVQLKEENESLQEEIEKLNSALAAFYGGTYTGSINSLRSPGTYWCDFSQVTGAIYDSGYGWIEVIKAYRDSDSCLQKIYHVSSTGIDVIAYRTYINNQWYPTRVLNTTGIS